MLENKSYCFLPFMDILGRKIPLMINHYNAGTDIYTIFPWVYFLGNKPLAVNMHGYLWGLLSIIFLYLLCLNFYHSKIYSILVGLVFATSPTFITASRIAAYTGTITIFFALASVFLLFWWKKKELKFLLFIMGLSMGIGLASRIQFLWFINTILIYLAFNKSLRRKFFKFKHLILFFCGITIGAFSLILGNLKGNFLTFRFLSQYAAVSRSGISNTDYLNNFFERFRESVSLINGNAFSSMQDLNQIGFYLFILGASFITYQKIRGLRKKNQKKDDNIIFPLFIFIGVLLQSSFTPTLFDVHHIILLLPFMCMIACLPCYTLGNIISEIMQSGAGILRSGRRFLQMAGCITFLLALFIFPFNNYRLLSHYKAHRNIHAGQELKWDVMSEVKNYLIAKQIKKIEIGDTGLEDQLLFLSGSELELEEVFPAKYKNLSLQEAAKELTKRINFEKEGYYLFRARDNFWIRFFEDFCNIVLKCGKKIDVEREFVTPEGTVVYVLYKVS